MKKKTEQLLQIMLKIVRALGTHESWQWSMRTIEIAFKESTHKLMKSMSKFEATTIEFQLKNYATFNRIHWTWLLCK